MTAPQVAKVLKRHVLAAALVAALVLAGTAAAYLAQDPVYEATAALEPRGDTDLLASILESRRYATSVADALEAQGHTLDAATLHGAAEVQPSGSKVTVTVALGSPTLAADVANAYVSTLTTWRPTLEELTWARNWERVHDANQGNTTMATRELQTMVESTVYYERSAWADPPAAPAEPNLLLHVAAGLVVGGVLAVLTALTLEARRDPHRRTRG